MKLLPTRDARTMCERRFVPLVVACLSLHLVLGVHTAWCKSVTHDELWHLPIGILNLQQRQFHFDRLNPPLSRMWAALPVCLTHVEPTGTPSDIGANFALHHGLAHWRYWFAGRVMNLLLSLATGALLAWEARALLGSVAGVFAAALYATEPTLLANASLVTPDVGLCLAMLVVLRCWRMWSQSPGWYQAAMLGLAIGAAQAVKFTALLIVPWWLGVVIFAGWYRRREARQWCCEIMLMVAAGVLALNVAYGLREPGVRPATVPWSSTWGQHFAGTIGPLGQLPWPVPSDYVLGLDEQLGIMQQLHPVFLDGLWHPGFRHYFLMCLWYKLSHGLQGFILTGIVLAIARREARLLAPMLLGAVMFGVASVSGMQIGVRYILPVIPLLILVAAAVATVWEGSRSEQSRQFLPIGAALLLLAPLRVHPHHLTFFNLAAGGPELGSLHLLDSNIDWGQDLWLVRDAVRQQSIDDLQLAYFGTLPPQAVGLKYRIPSPTNIQPGWYAISVNFIHGRPHTVRAPDGTSFAMDFGALQLFSLFVPYQELGHSIFLYRFDERDVDRWNRELRAMRRQQSAGQH